MSESQAAAAKIPLVSIGLSVFNGEAVVEEALRSVLSQSQDDWELIICDGASGDRTAEICRDYASRESRIRYHRSPRSLSFRVSHRLALGRARGRYFKWLQQGDRLQPSYVSTLQRVLDERAEVMLCNSVISRIDARGRTLGVLDSGMSAADSPSPARRFEWGVSQPLAPLDLYSGLARTDVLRELRPGTFPGAERAWLARLSLRGHLVQLPTLLQEMREHPPKPAFWQEFKTPSGGRLHREYLQMVSEAPLSRQERFRLLCVLGRAWTPGYRHLQPTLTQLVSLAHRAPVLAARTRSLLGQLVPQRRRETLAGRSPSE